MIEATSCGGVVIFRGKILLLYKNIRNKYEGWVLPKGTVEEGEDFKETALREVSEESGTTPSSTISPSQETPTAATSRTLSWPWPAGSHKKTTILVS